MKEKVACLLHASLVLYLTQLIFLVWMCLSLVIFIIPIYNFLVAFLPMDIICSFHSQKFSPLQSLCIFYLAQLTYLSSLNELSLLIFIIPIYNLLVAFIYMDIICTFHSHKLSPFQSVYYI